MSRCRRLHLLRWGFALMVLISAFLAAAMLRGHLPLAIFLGLVAVNGSCTGLVQNVAASLSAEFPDATGALLLGESLAPLVASAILLGIEFLGLSLAHSSALSLAVASCLNFGAIIMALQLSKTDTALLPSLPSPAPALVDVECGGPDDT